MIIEPFTPRPWCKKCMTGRTLLDQLAIMIEYHEASYGCREYACAKRIKARPEIEHFLVTCTHCRYQWQMKVVNLGEEK